MQEPLVFELLGGEVRAWLEQETIHLVAGDILHGDPAELTPGMARRLAASLQKMADQIGD
jgi:hypothetical protein